MYANTTGVYHSIEFISTVEKPSIKPTMQTCNDLNLGKKGLLELPLPPPALMLLLFNDNDDDVDEVKVIILDDSGRRWRWGEGAVISRFFFSLTDDDG